MNHAIAWHTAHPLWPLSLEDAAPTRFREPVLLRFAGDDFMEQLSSRLVRAPDELAELVAREETWRDERAGWLPEGEAVAALDNLKLYQPAHYRFYLVSAALVCQLPGLPEKRIDAAQGEKSSFVMRRLVPRPGVTFDQRDEATYDEYGWFGTAQQGVWLPLAERTQIAESEERLALFPTAFEFEHRPRRLLAGLIPVARRDVYQAGVARTAPPASAAQLRADTFATPEAGESFQRLNAALAQLERAHPPSTFGAAENALRAQAKEAFAHVLLDLVDYLKAHLDPVWNAIEAQSSLGLGGGRATLYSHLNRFIPSTSRRYRQVLRDVDQSARRAEIEEGTADAAFVNALLGVSVTRSQLQTIAADLRGAGVLHSLLVQALGDPRAAGFARTVVAPLSALSPPAATDAAAQDALLMALLALAEFLKVELPALWTAIETGNGAGLNASASAVFNALANTPLGTSNWRVVLADAEAHRLEILAGRITPAIAVIALGFSAAQIATGATFGATLEPLMTAALTAVPLPTPAQAQAALVATPPPEPDAPVWYRIRCVYERPLCRGVHDPVVSDPSAPFQLASFFDADAPVRPIRIQMPDVSLKALRKTPRGVSFALSKELREQIDRVRNAGMQNLIDGDIGSGSSFNFGLICSLSIPIITICALILLMIIVQLLNIVFWWLPYFILCLPRIGKGS